MVTYFVIRLLVVVRVVCAINVIISDTNLCNCVNAHMNICILQNIMGVKCIDNAMCSVVRSIWVHTCVLWYISIYKMPMVYTKKT